MQNQRFMSRFQSLRESTSIWAMNFTNVSLLLSPWMWEDGQSGLELGISHFLCRMQDPAGAGYLPSRGRSDSDNMGSSQILLAEGRPCWAVRQLWSVSRWLLLLFSCGKSEGTSEIYCGNMVECLKANLTKLLGPTYGIAQNCRERISSNSSILVPVLLSRHGWCSDFSLWLSASISLESLYLSVSNFGGQLFSCVPSPLLWVQ